MKEHFQPSLKSEEAPVPKGLKRSEEFLQPATPPDAKTHLKYVGEREGMRIYKGFTLAEMRERNLALNAETEVAQCDAALQICEAIRAAGGRAMIVGGAVRDEVMGYSPKDIDIEVYALSAEQIEVAVKNCAQSINQAGESFSVLKVTMANGATVDVSRPRTDSKTGTGHRDFTIQTDSNMSVKDAARRRDFTFNALAKDPFTGEIYDGFDGIPDVIGRILRATDVERFGDDALRVLRGAQFTSRFGLRVEAKTAELIHATVPDLKKISNDRFGEEWKKLLLKSPEPSLGLQIAMEWGIIAERYPELAALRETPQESEWHPEGDVWVHTLMVVDEAKRVARRERLDENAEWELVLAALCHDLGKPAVTKYEDRKGTMRWTANNHDKAGSAITVEFLKKLNVHVDIIARVVKLVENHLDPSKQYRDAFKVEIGSDGKPHRVRTDYKIDGPMRKLATRIAPSTIEMLTYVAEADHRGRSPFQDQEYPGQFLFHDFPDGAWMRTEAARVGVAKEKPRSILTGQELVGLGIGFEKIPPKERKFFGDFIKTADSLRDDKAWTRDEVLAILEQMHRDGKTPQEITSQLQSYLA